MKTSSNKIRETSFGFSKEEEIILLEKITIALKQVEDGDFLTEEEFDEEIEKWINDSE
jgi:hypothetical protein